MSDESAIIRLIGVVFGFTAAVTLLLMLTQFRKNKQLIKARLFLNYDKINRLSMICGIALAAGLFIQVAYISSGLDDNYRSWGPFFSSGVYAVMMYSGIIFISSFVYLMLRPVGK